MSGYLQMAPITAVIVHRAQPAYCVVTARALLAQDPAMRLLIVDNGSPADHLRRLRAEVPEAEVLELGGNYGFGPAANAGLRRWLEDGPGAGEWVFVCPHDAVVERGCVSRMLDAVADRPGAGLACAEYGDVDHGQRGTSGPLKPIVNSLLGGILVPAEGRPGWEDAGHPHGTFLMARRACLEQIGLFDERFFAYCEEADLGERARRAGWEVGIVWGAVVRNSGISSTEGVPEYLMLRNTLFLVRQHFGLYRATLLLLISGWITARGVIFPTRRCPYWHGLGRILALRDYLLGRRGPPPVELARGKPSRS